jgi:hypothetical protein
MKTEILFRRNFYFRRMQTTHCESKLATTWKRNQVAVCWQSQATKPEEGKKRLPCVLSVSDQSKPATLRKQNSSIGPGRNRFNGACRMPQSEPANNDLQLGGSWMVAATNCERVGDQSRNGTPAPALGKTGHFDHRRKVSSKSQKGVSHFRFPGRSQGLRDGVPLPH